jgi:phosphate uptake regulator
MTMHEDALAAFEQEIPALANDVIKRDMDADRLNWLIARQANMIMQNASLSRKWG